MTDSFNGLLQSFTVDVSPDDVHFRTSQQIAAAVTEIRAAAAVEGWEHPQCLQLINKLVDLYNDAHQFQYAQLLCSRLQLAYMRTFPATHKVQPQVGIKLANTLNSQANYAQAEDLYRKALSTYAAIGMAPHDPELCPALTGLAVSLTEQHKPAEAEGVLKQLLAIYSAVHGDNHKETLGTINRLAQALEAQGKGAEAEALCADSFDRCLAALGEEDAITQSAAAALARLKQSEEMYRKAIRITAHSLGSAHPNTLKLEDALAALLLQKGDVEGADALYREVLRKYEQTAALGPADPLTLAVCESLGGLYLCPQLNDPLTSRAFYLRCYEGRCAYFKSSAHPLALRALFHLGRTYHAECAWRHRPSYADSLASALRMLTEAYRGLLLSSGRCAPMTLQAARHLGAFLVAYQRTAEAVPVYAHLYEVYVASSMPVDLYAVEVAMQHGALHEARRLYPQACDLYAQALRMLKEVKGEGAEHDEEVRQREQDCRDHLQHASRIRDMS